MRSLVFALTLRNPTGRAADPLLDGRRFRAAAILSELAARSEFFTRRSIARIG
jgi:hypothetical protein